MNLFKIDALYMKYFFPIIFMLLGLFGCEAPPEGCMDVLAQNYDAEADTDCCCTYYQLQWNLQHAMDDSAGTTFSLFEKYADIQGDSFEVGSSNLYISQVQLLDDNGMTYDIEDSLLIDFQDGSSSWYKDDFSLIRTTQFTYNFGKFTQFGNYSKLRFLVGILPELGTSSQSSFEETHVLNDAFGMYAANLDQYYSGKFTIINSSIEDTINLSLTDTLMLEFPINLTATDGNHTSISVILNYNKLLEDIAIAQDDSTTLINKIKNNLPNAFVLE